MVFSNPNSLEFLKKSVKSPEKPNFSEKVGFLNHNLTTPSPIPYLLSPNSARVESEKLKDCKPSMAETLFFNALREAIDEEMARDSAVLVMGEDVGHYGGS